VAFYDATVTLVGYGAVILHPLMRQVVHQLLSRLPRSSSNSNKRLGPRLSASCANNVTRILFFSLQQQPQLNASASAENYRCNIPYWRT
jgi:hypothetical protein